MLRRRCLSHLRPSQLSLPPFLLPRSNNTNHNNSSSSTIAVVSHHYYHSHAIATSVAALTTATRHVHHIVNAANFDADVVQSQQAICLVYYVPGHGGCQAYLAETEKIVDRINAETSSLGAPPVTTTATGRIVADPQKQKDDTVAVDLGDGRVVTATADGDQNDNHNNNNHQNEDDAAQKKKTMSWLKLCFINADENRNLASAFSVERAKLPITYFIMQSTIIDKVTGAVAPKRIESILYKFLEHYQKELNVDLLQKRNAESLQSDTNGGGAARHGEDGGFKSPLPSATPTDLVKGASTNFLIEKIFNALVGSDRITLPAQAEQIDGLKKTIQQAKQKAHEELQLLYKELGLDVRRWSEAELIAHYYKNNVFIAMGVLTALEGLFLARCYAALGDVDYKNVQWAKNDLLKNFEPVLGEKKIKVCMALLDANVVKGQLRTAALLASQDANRLAGALAAMEADHNNNQNNNNNNNHRSPQEQQRITDLQDMAAFIESQKAYCVQTLQIIDEHIDTPHILMEEAEKDSFPQEVVEQLFDQLKMVMKERRQLQSENIRQQKQSNNNNNNNNNNNVMMDSTSLVTEDAQQNAVQMINTTAKRLYIMQQREDQTKTLIMCILQIFAQHPQSQVARSRFASLLY